MERISKMWRSGLSLVLALCLIISACPVVAFAAEAEPAKKYVSLGDSMTNGYGLTGYDNPYRVNGFLDEVLDAYPYQLQNELNFDLTAQLATSALRAEDLNFILRYPNAKADPYTNSEFVNGRWTDYAGIDNSKSGVANVAKIFQTNVANADVISYSMGNANFGVFMLGRLTEALNIMVKDYDAAQAKYAWVNFENALGNLDASQKKVALEAYNQGVNMLKKYMPAGLSADKIDRLANILGFTIASYLDSTEAALDRINELNPDAEIIIVGIQNNFDGVDLDFTVEGKAYSIPMSALLAPFVEGANAYLSVLPSVKHAAGEWTGNTFYYAEAGKVGMIVETYNDEIKGDNAIRTRFIEEVCGTVFPMVEDAFNDLLADTDLALDDTLTRADVEAYEANPTNSGLSDNKILSVAIYLAFEKAVLEAADMKSLDATAFVSVAGDLSKVFEPVADTLESELDMDAIADTVIEEVKAEAIAQANAYKATYSAEEQDLFDKLVDMADGVDASLAVVVAHYALETEVVKIEEIKDIAGLLNAKDIVSQVNEDEIVEWAEDKYGDVLKHSTAIHTAAEIIEPLADALVSTPVLKSLLNLFARMLIGNGIGCHPSAAGHDALTAAIVKAYETKHTTEDEVEDDINYVLGELKNFLETYGPEAADQAYKMWVEMGYQDLVDECIDELDKAVTDRYTNYTEVILPALNDAIDALNVQKDALNAELVTLKDQLTAKKAELLKVLSEQEITDITPPDFNIETELGNNEQTQVPENDCAGAGNVADELAAAIADLEHAIAVVEALIADVTADIEDMVALATEIAEGIASLEQTIADIATAAQDMKDAVDAVVDVLTNESAQATSKTFMNAFNAAREAAQIAVEAVELLVETVNDDFAAIEASVETLKEYANKLVAKFADDKDDILDQIKADIPVEGAALVAAPIILVQQALEQNKDAIIDALNAEKDALLVKLNKEKDALLVELNKEKDALLVELNNEKDALLAEYGPQIDKALADISNLQTTIDDEIQTAYAALQSEAQGKIDALKQNAQNEIDKLNAELQGYMAQLAGDISDELRAEIQPQIDRINNDIAAINADLADAISHVNVELQNAYDALVAEVTNAYNQAMTELKNIHDALVNEYNNAVKELQDAYDTAVKDLQDAYDTAVKNLQDAYDAAVKALQDAADKAINDLIDAAQKELDKLGQIGDMLNDVANGIFDAIRNDISNVQGAVSDILSGVQGSVDDLADALVDTAIDGINALVDEVTDIINGMIYESTHSDLELEADSVYVALGDGTAAPEGYAEELFAQLNAEYGVTGFKNYATTGNTVGAEIQAMAYNRPMVADADLITIGFGNVTLLNNAIRNAGRVDYNWAELVGEDLVPYVEDALNEAYAKVEELELAAGWEARVKSIIEGVAYGTVEYMVKLPELISAIRAVNPDAVIVIVGQYNPMDGVVLDLGGVTLDVSEYIDYFVEGISAYGIGYSMITGDAIFVEAPEVATKNTDMSWTEDELIFDLLPDGFSALNPNEAGAVYIANQILDALNITKIESGLWGDANNDGKVNVQDAILILKVASGDEEKVINRFLSDVTGDGKIGVNDAIYVLKRSSDDPTLFPVEK